MKIPSNYYDKRKLASSDLRQLTASKATSVEEMIRFVDVRFGFTKRFVFDWLEKYVDALEENDGLYKWKL